MMQDAFRAVEEAARASSGKVLAYLLKEGFTLEEGEDAVASALERALHQWPESDPPQAPEAWLLTVARRKALDAKRQKARLQPLDSLSEQADPEPMTEPRLIADERLRLFFLCTHPAIELQAQTPLMLQLILGFTAEQIAGLYLASPPAVSQRLVRAKKKIRDAGIQPSLPGPDQVVERLEGVLAAIYGLYCAGWELPGEEETAAMADEALALARTLSLLAPGSAEAKGLLALILLSESRRGARRSPDGHFVPLDLQDRGKWDEAMQEEGDEVLRQAARHRVVGRCQLEAAIQSAHIHRLRSGSPGWEQILTLYNALVQAAPTASARLGRLAALAKVSGPAAALAELEGLDLEEEYQPYWALKGHLHRQLGQEEEGGACLARAKALTRDPALAEHLSTKAT